MVLIFLKNVRSGPSDFFLSLVRYEFRSALKSKNKNSRYRSETKTRNSWRFRFGPVPPDRTRRKSYDSPYARTTIARAKRTVESSSHAADTCHPSAVLVDGPEILVFYPRFDDTHLTSHYTRVTLRSVRSVRSRLGVLRVWLVCDSVCNSVYVHVPTYTRDRPGP